MPIILSAPAKRKNTRAKTLSRNEKAEARVAEALRGGLILHFSSAGGDGTVGPYHTAVGPKRYAFFRYGRRPLERQGTLLEIAGTAVSEAGVGNIIDALKGTGKYVNLDTPLSVQVSLVPVTRKNARKTVSRLSGVEATYMGRVAGRSLAVDGVGAEYMLDPEAVAEKGLRKGDAVVVRAVPGQFATFRKTVTRKNARKTALPPMRNNGSRSVVDAVAARELELYVENEASLIGPGNTLGANVMRMLAARIVRGTYDNTKAWKAWSPLVAEGAKRYKREIGSLNASKATRDAVATRLSEAFEGAVRSGALNPMKLLGAR